MGNQPARQPATYEELLAVPEHLVAEIIDGELFTFPRPSSLHARAATRLSNRLGPPFDEGVGGPGGWILLDEPEVHLGPHVAVPDLAAWRRDRLPELPDVPYFTLAPDWLCEVLSPSTERMDRLRKLRVYAEFGVLHAWLVSPSMQSLEAYRLLDGHYALVATHSDAERVRVEPFADIELDLATLWAR
jgi:Uma2 family endonuclease